jgi:hypothetical protein
MHPPNSEAWANAVNLARKSVKESAPKITAARDALLCFLGSEGRVI